MFESGFDKTMIEKFEVEHDIKVFCEKAKTFPGGIKDAHDELHSIIAIPNQRQFFGISHPNEKGIIVYKAAAEEIYQGEAEELGCETFVIENGTYISLLIHDYAKDIASIEKAFHELTSNPDIDPEGYCIEWYIDVQDVRCMVKLIC